MLYEPSRHEPLTTTGWDEAVARQAIEFIVGETREQYSIERYWPPHPKDLEVGDDPAQPVFPLYFGAAGVVWAQRYLRQVGATQAGDVADFESLLTGNRAWLAALPRDESASFLMGDTPILMMAQDKRATVERADVLAKLIDANIDHPARELMWGSPGTMLAALFLHERFGDARWADAFRRTAQRLWAALSWSDEHRCHFWTQELYGRKSTYLDAIHGLVATAAVLIKGRHLFAPSEWSAWQQVIETTIERTATREPDLINWRTQLIEPAAHRKWLMQFCHGAPGFVICLSRLPGTALDELLIGAGEAIWRAGPLQKGANLCHGTGGNGYAFLKLFERTGDPRWLERARAFAMHGIEQMHNDRREFGQLRYSLWTGDLGFAIYLWDCVRAQAEFPTLDVFFGAASA